MPNEEPNAQGGELRGGYAEDTQVTASLEQADFTDHLTRQLMQYGVTVQQQIHQAALQDQRMLANAMQLLVFGLAGKTEMGFPKSLVDNVVLATEGVSKTVNDDTSDTFSETSSKNTMDNMLDRFSKIASAFEKATTQQATQQITQQEANQLTAALSALTAKIDSLVE